MGKDKKDYSSGSGKKWGIFFGIVVLVAIIVVVIILAIPPNTYNAVEILNRTSSSSYLTVESENEAFKAFKEKMGQNTVVSGYQTELNDIETMADSINIILDFHNEYLVLAKNNKNLKKNYKAIKNGLKEAKESQKRLVNTVEKINKLSKNSSTYLKGAMVDYREDFIKYLKNCKRAIGGLENAYTGSLGDVTFNNLASKIILNTVNDYIEVIYDDFVELKEKDTKSYSMTDYSAEYQNLALSSKINLLNTFVKAKLEDETNKEIENYYFLSDIQESYENLNEYFDIAEEKNLVIVIDSINSAGNITAEFEGEGESAYAEAISKFIKGGL